MSAKHLLSAAALVATTVQAGAADLPVIVPFEVPVVVPAPLFQGFTAGLALSGIVGPRADRTPRPVAKVLTVPGANTTGLPGQPANAQSIVNGSFCSLSREQDLTDGDIDCSSNNVSGTTTQIMDGPLGVTGPITPAQIQQFTIPQLLAGGPGVPPLTPAARALLLQELARLQSGAPLTGLFGFQPVTNPAIVEAVGADPLGGIGGALSFGYTHQFGNFTAGVEARGGYADMSGEFDYVPIGRTAQTGLIAQGEGVQEIEYYGLLRAKVGYAFDRLNPYVTAGAAGANVEVSLVDPTTFASAEEEEFQFGYTLGAGVNFALTDSVQLNLDYAYVDLGENDYTFSPTFAVNDLQTEAHIVSVGVNFAFGGF